MKMKLTAAAIGGLELPPGKSDDIVFDTAIHGFGVRLRDGGHRSFVYQYKLGSKQRRLTIGSVSAVDFGAACRTAKDLYAQVRLGRDPAGEKERAKLKANETFGAVVAAQYLEHKRRELKPQSFRDVERHLLRHAKPLHRLQLETISRRDVASCLASVRENVGRISANRTRNSLSALFSWAMGEGLVEANPVVGTTRVKEESRERVLSLDELRLIWNALPDRDFRFDHEAIDADRGACERDRKPAMRGSCATTQSLLPGSRTKNGREHLIPLSEAASEILKANSRHHKDEERTPCLRPSQRTVQRMVKMQTGSRPAHCRSSRASRWRLGASTTCAEASQLKPLKSAFSRTSSKRA